MANVVEILIRGKDEASGVLKNTVSNLIGFTAQTTLAVQGVTKLAGALFDLATATADFNESILTASERTGISTEKLSVLKFTAEQAESSFDSLKQGLKALALSMGEAERKAGDDREVFQALGISLKDAHGNARDVGDVFIELSGKLARMAEGAQKTQVTTILLKKAAEDLIPVMNELGRKGFAQVAEEAEKANAVVTHEEGLGGKSFNDALKDLTNTITGVGTAVGNFLNPYLVRTLEITNDLIRNIDKFASPGLRALMGDPVGAFRAMREAEAQRRRDAAGEGRIEGPPAELLRTVLEGQLQIKLLTDEQKKAMKETAQAAKEAAKDIERITAQARESVLTTIVPLDDPLKKAAEEFKELAEEAIKARREVEEFWKAHAVGFPTPSSSAKSPVERAIEELEAKADETVDKEVKKAEKLKKANLKMIEDIRDAAGHVWDEMFQKGQNIFTSLANLAKGLLNTIARQAFQSLAVGLLGGGGGGGGGLLGGILGKLGGRGTGPMSEKVPGAGGGILGSILGGGSIFGKSATGSTTLFGLGLSTAIPIVGGIAAGIFGLTKLFGHKTQEAPFSTDPYGRGPSDRTVFFYSGLTEAINGLKTVVAKLEGVSPYDVVMMGKNAIVDAAHNDNSFVRGLGAPLLEEAV